MKYFWFMKKYYEVLKRYSLPFFLSLFLCLLAILFRGGYVNAFGLTGLPLSLLVGCILFFALTLILLYELKSNVSKSGIVLAIILCIIVLEVPIRFISFKSTLISLPDTLFRIVAVVVAYGVFKIRNTFCKIVVSVLFFALCTWVSYYRYSSWIFEKCYDLEKPQSIRVQFPESDISTLLCSELFSNIELIPLLEKSAPIITSHYANMIVKNNTFYIGDVNLGKVCLFDQSGKYLNSIGSKGRGPGEYYNFRDFTVEENGNISIYGIPNWSLYTYTPQGALISQTEYLPPSISFAKLNDYQYHFLGHGSRHSFQLYITDNQHKLIDSCFTAYNVRPMETGTSPFTKCNKTLYLCPPEGGEVYRISGRNYVPQMAYSFDFDKYALPDGYFQHKGNHSELMDLLRSKKEVAFKCSFFENETHSVLAAIIANYTNLTFRMLYGIMHKKSDRWHWFYMKENDLMYYFNLKYLDDTALYFIAEPAEMKEAGLSNLFPELGQLSDYDNVIVFKCNLKN
jgi:hypothetical protein